MNDLIKEVVEKKVKELINLEEDGIIDADEDLALYGMDSLLYIRMIVDIEEYYSITYTDEMLDFESMSSIRKIVNTLENMVQANRMEKD